MSLQLCINISRTSAHVAEVSRSSKSVIREASLNFSSFVESEIKAELKQFMEKENFLQDYDEYSLAYWNELFTVVPFNLIDSKNYSDVFKLCFGADKVSNSEIDYNMLPHLGVSTIFHIPNWIKSFFIIKFPRIILQHGLSMLLNGMNEESSFKPNIHLHLEDEYFLLTVFANNELKFTNSFAYQNEDDILYHTVHALKKIEVLFSAGQLNIVGIRNTVELNLLKDKFENFEECKKYKISVDTNKLYKHHLQCV